MSAEECENALTAVELQPLLPSTPSEESIILTFEPDTLPYSDTALGNDESRALATGIQGSLEGHPARRTTTELESQA